MQYMVLNHTYGRFQIRYVDYQRGMGGSSILEGETLGSRMRARREHLRMTQAKLASLVGLSNRAINQIESGILNKSIMADHLPKIAAELGTTLDILLNGEIHSVKATRDLLQRLRSSGKIRSDSELKAVEELAAETIKKRSNANIPLNEDELLILVEVIRGADGL